MPEAQDGNPDMVQRFQYYRPMSPYQLEIFFDIGSYIEPKALVTIPAEPSFRAEIFLNEYGVFIVDILRIVDTKRLNFWQIQFVVSVKPTYIDPYTLDIRFSTELLAYYLSYPPRDKDLYPSKDQISNFVGRKIAPSIISLSPMAIARLSRWQ
ncbi:MAG: hypothetical protein ACFFDI_14335 [Promethearchaeota archaeon]